MRRIGFDGGSVLWELGFPSDVLAFFECIKRYAITCNCSQDYELLTDRLFRRFLRLEELETATKVMIHVHKQFADIPSADVNWSSVGVDVESTELDVSQATLADVFARFFAGFSNCVESAKSFFQDWNTYQPVRIVIVDQPWFMVDKYRALEEYESLVGQPFWLP